MDDESPTSNQPQSVTTPVAMQLFSAILGPQAQPVDLVAARCAAKDGAAWSAGVLARRGATLKGVAQWTAWKSSAKADFDRVELRSQNPAALESFLEYSAAIAGALTHEHTLISTMPREEIRRMLRVVGAGLTGEWREVFDRAITSLAEISQATPR
ncbi:MAG: hypothetical protein EXS17_02735 [Phycisphaerales bacterium]|nr:hypothetical protein [Phycisphaerales bacterium]